MSECVDMSNLSIGQLYTCHCEPSAYGCRCHTYVEITELKKDEVSYYQMCTNVYMKRYKAHDKTTVKNFLRMFKVREKIVAS